MKMAIEWSPYCGLWSLAWFNLQCIFRYHLIYQSDLMKCSCLVSKSPPHVWHHNVHFHYLFVFWFWKKNIAEVFSSSFVDIVFIIQLWQNSTEFVGRWRINSIFSMKMKHNFLLKLRILWEENWTLFKWRCACFLPWHESTFDTRLS